jgi:recombinational DNA repair protein (RecF pathway)
VAQSFSNFITEEKKEENYNVVILTVEFGDKSITAKKFEKEAQKMGMKTFLANFKEVSLHFNDGKHTLSDGKKRNRN